MGIEHLLEQVSNDEDILAVLLYGSRARGEEGPHSDYDICLVLQPERDLQQDRIQARLNYLPEREIDVQIFQALPLYIRTRVLKEGSIVFCRNLDILYELAYRTAKAFEDFRPRYRHYLDQVANAGS